MVQALGISDVALSHQVSALPWLVPCGKTTMVKAYGGQVFQRYLSQLRHDLGEGYLAGVR